MTADILSYQVHQLVCMTMYILYSMPKACPGDCKKGQDGLHVLHRVCDLGDGQFMQYVYVYMCIYGYAAKLWS